MITLSLRNARKRREQRIHEDEMIFRFFEQTVPTLVYPAPVKPTVFGLSYLQSKPNHGT